MLESFQGNRYTYQRLSEDEQKKRGILGRLVGIIADTNNPTRNGRLYSAKLWENVFKNPIMKEKIKNRVCFGELDHPVDREEVDTSKIAVCLAEEPKIGDDGNLYGVFDILSTPNGKILKTLCDYGSTIGISSRGSGDVLDDDTVDPDTYDCVGFDVVLVPAVESARLQYVTESLDTKNNKSMKQALLESYNKADDEGKKIMKETLDNLHINLNEAADDDIKLVRITTDDNDNVIEVNEFFENLNEAADEKEDEKAEDSEVAEETKEKDTDKEEEVADDNADEAETTKDKEEEKEDEVVDEKEEKSAEAITIKDFVDSLKDYDKDDFVVFAPIEIDGKEHEVDAMEVDDESTDDTILIRLVMKPEEKDEDEKEEEIKDDQDTEKVEDDFEVFDIDSLTDEEDTAKNEEKADDDGVAEMLESVKELVREKASLEESLEELKKSRAVGDAKVTELNEELEKYKQAFARVSKIASNAKRLNNEVDTLNEQLTEKDKLIENLSKNAANVLELNESIAANNATIKELTEQLQTAQQNEDSISKKYNESLNIAKNYKTKYTAILNHYINYRASALGVKASDITNKLNESYTLSDIDTICDKLLESDITFNRLPFAGNKKVKMTEDVKNVNNRRVSDPDDGYEIDDDLLRLAGLKE